MCPLEKGMAARYVSKWHVAPPVAEDDQNSMGRARQVPKMDDPLSRCSTYKRYIYIYTVCIAYNILSLLFPPLEEAYPLEEGPLLYASFGRGKKQLEKPGAEADDSETGDHTYEYNRDWNVQNFRQAFCHTWQVVTIF